MVPACATQGRSNTSSSHESDARTFRADMRKPMKRDPGTLVRTVTTLPARVGGVLRSPLTGTSSALLVTHVLTAGIAVVSARALGPAGKGQVTAVLAWAQILVFIFLFGLNAALPVRIPESGGHAARIVLGNTVVYAM